MSFAAANRARRGGSPKRARLQRSMTSQAGAHGTRWTRCLGRGAGRNMAPGD